MECAWEWGFPVCREVPRLPSAPWAPGWQLETLLLWLPGQVLGTPLVSTNVSAASSAGLCGEPLGEPLRVPRGMEEWSPGGDTGVHGGGALTLTFS